MMEMSISLDREKIEKESKLTYDETCKHIDDVFAKYRCIKVQKNILRYAGDPKVGNFLNSFGCVKIVLEKSPWFLDYCTSWVWYDNDHDETKPYREMDVLVRCKMRLK